MNFVPWQIQISKGADEACSSTTQTDLTHSALDRIKMRSDID